MLQRYKFWLTISLLAFMVGCSSGKKEEAKPLLFDRDERCPISELDQTLQTIPDKNGSEPWKRSAAIDELRQRGQEGVPPLCDQLKRERFATDYEIVEALGRMGADARRAIPILLALRLDPLFTNSINTLTHTKQQAQKLDVAIQSIGYNDDADRVRVALEIVPLLKEKNDRIRRGAAVYLGECKFTKHNVGQHLISLLSDDSELSRIAARSVGPWNCEFETAKPLLREKLKAGYTDYPLGHLERIRHNAVIVAGHYVPESHELVVELAGVLSASADDAGLESLRVLTRLGSRAKPALPTLQGLRNSMERIPINERVRGQRPELERLLDLAIKTIEN